GSAYHPTTKFTDKNLVIADTFVYIVGAIDLAGNEKNSTALTVSFTPGDIIECKISLEASWNLFSLPLIPDDNSIEVILADMMENFTIVLSYEDDTWLSYIPGIPSEYNSLTHMDDGIGYWILMTAADTLTVYGLELPGPGELPPVYDVYEGWNLIGFKELYPMEINAYIATIPGFVRASSVCYGWDATVQEYEMVYLAGYPINVGELYEALFYPGQGYWLYLTDDANIAPP
ncbi:unnamed protein product, partial [marine sediment metagenome]